MTTPETLRLRRDYLAANKARRVVTPGFILLVNQRGDGDPKIRAGYTVTKKIGNAVVRNRMKRRLRALARELLPAEGSEGADHVLIGREAGVERDFAQLRSELQGALARLRR
jgi:ribonuclease P protein component